MSFAFVFPGQGSQSVGMLGALAAADPSVRGTLEEASAVLGFDLWRLVSEGPEEALNAAERLRERLRSLEVRVPRIRYVSAVDASAHERPDEIRELLVRQLSNPVRWSDTLRALSAGAIAQVIECGPGRVLTGLNRRIERR